MDKPVTRLEEFGADVARRLEALSPERELAIERARRAFLEPAPLEPNRRSWFVRGSALLAAIAAAALFFVIGQSRPLTFSVDGQSASPDSWLAATPTRPLEVGFSDGTRVRLGKSSRARVVALAADGAQILLESGSVHAEVVHTKSSAWWWTAGPFRVHVTGTRFNLEWDPTSQQFELEVLDGSVGVSGPVIGAERAVRAGETLRASVSELGLELVRRQTGNSALPNPSATAPAPSASVPERIDASEILRAPSPSASSRKRDPLWRDLAARGALREAFAAAESAGFNEACQNSNAAELLLLGDAARLAGRADRASEALLALRQRFPSDSRRSAAAFVLGKVAFDQRRAYAEAASWFSKCVSEQPHGSFAREALGRLIEAWRLAGNPGAARDAARAYLEHYPQGPHAKLAHSLLD